MKYATSQCTPYNARASPTKWKTEISDMRCPFRLAITQGDEANIPANDMKYVRNFHLAVNHQRLFSFAQQPAMTSATITKAIM